MIQTLTVNGLSVDTVVMPYTPGFKMVEWGFGDTVGEVTSPFTHQSQTQEWMGADYWYGTMTLPLLTQVQAKEWLAFLMQCRGIRNPFLLGDPLQMIPTGNPQGSVPLVDNATTGTNLAGAQVVHTKGWTASRFRLLVHSDDIQIGYRRYRVLDIVNSDVSGNASIAIWPALREQPADGASVILANPAGLMRRANNEQVWSATIGNLTSLSFQVKEYR